MSIAHSREQAELQNLNNAQSARIKALTVANDGRGVSCEDSETLLEENTHLQKENEELAAKTNELQF